MRPQGIPTWNNYAHKFAEMNMNGTFTEQEVGQAYLKAALDFYLLGLADFILAPFASFFSESAAR